MWWWRFRQILARRRSVAAIAIGLALVVGGATALRSTGRSGGGAGGLDGPAPGIGAEPASTPTLLVFVSGAVSHPGLYRLTASARVADALAAAGGTTSKADPGHLPNEAARLRDGHQVNVPFLHATRGASAARLDINTAGIEELRAIPDMPLGLADAIVDVRTRWGAFTSIGELRDALGVDRATVTALSRELWVGPRP